MPDSQVKEFPPRFPEAANTRGIKAIVADDDEVVQEIVAAPLRKWGLEIVTARDGNEALQAFRKLTGPVLAIFDWVMPGLDGLELCRRIRAEARLVYILLLTARGGKQNVVQGLQAGADDYLVKRISQEELCVRLRLGIRILTLEADLAAQTVGLSGTTG